MSTPCPKCGRRLSVDKAPRAHAQTRCPYADCDAELVFTGSALPFDPEQHGFTLRTWESVEAEPDRVENASLLQCMLIRVFPALACGLLTGIAVSLAWSSFDHDASLWTIFLIALGGSAIPYTVVLGLLHARDRRSLAKAMRFVNERIRKAGPVVKLRPKNEVHHEGHEA